MEVLIPLLWAASGASVLPLATSQARSQWVIGIPIQHPLKTSATIERPTTSTIGASTKGVLTMVSGHSLQRTRGPTGLRQTAKLRQEHPSATAQVGCHQLPLAMFTTFLQNSREPLARTGQDISIRGGSTGCHLQISVTQPRNILWPPSVLPRRPTAPLVNQASLRTMPLRTTADTTATGTSTGTTMRTAAPNHRKP